MFHINVGIAQRRGILIYVAEILSSAELYFDIPFNECIFVQAKDLNNIVLTVGAVYRSPSSDNVNDENLCKLITEACKSCSGRLLLIGDYNLPNIDWTSWTALYNLNIESLENKFLQCLQYNLLQQHVTFPTRARGTNIPHTLDLVITNDDFVNEINNLSPLGKSDHSVLHCVCNLSVNYTLTHKFNYGKGDYNRLRESVSNYLLHNFVIDNNVNDVWNEFKSVINDNCKTHIPLIASNTWRKKSS
jgi:hypothetical protein